MDGLGEKLRARARELGLTDTEVARRAGLSQSRYANYVVDKREPDFATFIKICRILGTTPDLLLDFRTSETAPSESEQLRQEIQAAALSMTKRSLQTLAEVANALAAKQENPVTSAD
jgi:Helix-turn-helix.